MSATLISLEDYANSLEAEADSCEGIHPSGAQIIHEWLSKLREAEDAAEVRRLSKDIMAKIELEAAWYRESLESARRPLGG